MFDARLVKSLDDVAALSADVRGKCVSIDTETTGLDPWGDAIVGISIHDPLSGTAWYAPLAHDVGLFSDDENASPAAAAALGAWLRSVDVDGVVWLGWNVNFDRHFLRNAGVCDLTRAIDVMAWWHALDEVGPRALKKRAAALGVVVSGGKDVVDAAGGAKMIRSMLPRDVLRYAAGDAWLTTQMWLAADARIAAGGCPHTVLSKERLVTDLLCAMEERGLCVDVEKCTALAVEARGAMHDEMRKLEDGGVRVNPMSDAEVMAALRIDSSTADAIAGSAAWGAEHILRYRKWAKAVGSFYEPLVARTRGGVVHPSINQCGTRTWRWSCSQPNLQALPRDSEFHGARACIVPREGHRFVQWDYSQAELRVLAHMSGDKRLSAAMRSGEDIHWATARGVFGDNATTEDRRVAKGLNFGAVYGAGADCIARVQGRGVERAKEALDQFHEMYPGIRKLRKRLEKQAASGSVPVWGGGIRHFAPNSNEEWKGMSYAIQGTVAEVVKDGALRIDALAREYGGALVLQVHDELIAEIPEDHAGTVLERGTEALQDFPFDVPLTVQGAITASLAG